MKPIISLLAALLACHAHGSELDLSGVTPDIRPKAVELDVEKREKKPVGKSSTGKEPKQYKQLYREYSTAPTLIDPNKPAGATARCNDGSYGFPGKNGACYKHGGVSAWLK